MKLKFLRKTFLWYLLAEVLLGFQGLIPQPTSLAYSQVSLPVGQSITFSTVAPPSNSPLLTSSLSCTGSAGSFSAGTLVVAYTYTGTDSNSESKASSDGGSTLTTLVTCPANGTLTIPSPPSPPGCFNCVGWRPYVIASTSGTGAELLQTITSANCTLASTASLTSCAIGSSFTETSLGAGAGEPSNPTLFTSGTGGLVAQTPITENSNYANHVLSWVTTGTAATCSIAIQTASTQTGSFTTMTGTTAQTCTSSGAYEISGQTANFVRLGPLTFTASGSNTPSITITLTSSPPAIGTGATLSCGSTGSGNQTCAPAAGGRFQTYVGSSTLAANTATITFPLGFTSTTSYFCVANDVTTRANPVQMVPASATTATITNTTGATDVIQWICTGN